MVNCLHSRVKQNIKYCKHFASYSSHLFGCVIHCSSAKRDLENSLIYLRISTLKETTSSVCEKLKFYK